MDQASAITTAANEAVFAHQLNTTRAVGYICRAVPDCTEDQARQAVRRAATFHQR